MAAPPAILVLDDDQAILELVRDTLSERYQVYTAADILAATDIISTRHLDLIIADLNMPIVNGIEMIDHIRAFPRFDRTPILVISAYPELAERLERHAVDGFLPKPFSLPVLTALVDTLIRRSRPL